MPSDHATQVKDFHAQQEQASEIPEDRRSILLTTANRETGAPRSTWVEFFLDEDRRILVVALPDGTRTRPGWYDDLLAEPQVTLENGAFRIEALAALLEEGERDAALDRAAELDPVLRRERSLAPEPPPVVALKPLAGRPVGTTWGSGLKLIHDAFRRELAVIRSELARPGTHLGAQLRINCLALCGGLGHHHRSEDDQLLPVVTQHHPELADAVRRLRAEHTAMDALLQQLQQVVGAAEVDRASVRTEVDRLSAAVEAHLDYEEAQLLPILDRLSAKQTGDDSA
ncbi:nitroreductase family deazaflavin-dependent oxidoreductase [Salinispora cortesiana]|uniref:nitroreductase family deazaflavin-dependent oxidoreductase n=1 Tax=Salinispora cortesiana TaxID=1305843 RepID=UPI0004070397|nr:nitroreductase family deazaflavin-dependent oxidoreductase [Salinispora cortesiana]